jgi:hypothetical protein
MKRELDPFESKLKEKLQGKAYFPEDILWKRLNDELVRSDQVVHSKKRYWILGTALLVLLSLSTGYFIGLNQRETAPLAHKGSTSLSKRTHQNHQISETNKTKIVAQTDETIDVSKIELIKTIQSNFNRSVEKPIFEKNVSKGKIIGEKDHPVEMVNSESKVKIQPLTTTNENITDNVLSESPELSLNPSNLNPLTFPLDRLTLLKAAKLVHEQHTFIPSVHSKRLPFVISASLSLEPGTNNRFVSNHVYGTNPPFTGKEIGLATTNVRIGFQAQLGKHLELSSGIGSSSYLTVQHVQNQPIGVDPFHHQLNFESSISSFQIHEDHLHDDPEDQEENELNFEDSTQFHLSYQLTNSVKSIQVPIMVGFVFQVNKMKFSLKSGLLYNHISNANQLVNIAGFNSIRNDIKSQLVSTNYYHSLQFGAEYSISRHLSFMLSPKYSYALKSISKSTMLRPNSLGMECALKFYF